MALSGIEIFKLLPKTNCKKCGFPTCLAFAMALAQGKTDMAKCPDISEESKRKLGEASTPDIRTFTLGKGERAVKIGGETVLFRHEKKFFNPTVLGVNVKDDISSEELLKIAKEVVDSEIVRVGQRLRVEAVSIEYVSKEPKRYESAVKTIAENAPDAIIILRCDDPAVIESVVKIVADRRPLVYCAGEGSIDAVSNIAKTHGIPVVISAKGPEGLSELTQKVASMGVQDIVIDPLPRDAKEILQYNTLIRRSALKKGFKPLGYPIINFIQRDDPILESCIASISIAKYASIVILGSIERWKNLALFTLRQNIYTDPQVPMQVEQKIYKIGEPSPDSPLLITTNFSLTYFIVAGEIENSKVPSWLAVMDCEGLSVLTAWAAGKFVASRIANFIKESKVEEMVKHRELIIPGQVAILSGALEDKLEGWKVIVGPREANGIPTFLRSRAA